jgi:hypothetical protein
MTTLKKSPVKYRNLDKKTHVVVQDINNNLNTAIEELNGIGFKGTIHTSQYAPKSTDGENGDMWIQISE